jgi:3'-5' exonuclease
MIDHIKIGNVLFLDIETVPAYATYEEVPSHFKALWERKAAHIKKDVETPEELYQRAGIYAEFGRIICVSTGMLGLQDDKRVFRLKSFYADNEKDLLADLADLLTRICQKREIDLCAHNGKEFDFPYIARRMLINGISLPAILDTSGKKPWETKFLDTLELWKFGDHKHYTSLDLLTAIFGIESPKSDIDGSQVASVYWNDKNLIRIVEYCRRDVIAIAMLLLKFKGEGMLKPEDIVVLD